MKKPITNFLETNFELPHFLDILSSTLDNTTFGATAVYRVRPSYCFFLSCEACKPEDT